MKEAYEVRAALEENPRANSGGIPEQATPPGC